MPPRWIPTARTRHSAHEAFPLSRHAPERFQLPAPTAILRWRCRRGTRGEAIIGNPNLTEAVERQLFQAQESLHERVVDRAPCGAR
ncbi:hypothetical protein STRIP9103_05568 [Streptomyces ipomoeae 91-03]|uniref:Uncharacterized protein n=1 Tax=Streptomyces ipomoeae 91-03 TaxID=698759 RepID=L1L4I1_9ACTN|nr:hypothetical protein STRIP9103_05568 [Streptomyces ipomoeae 91-03]